MDINKNIDDDDISPASRPTNPYGVFLDFRFVKRDNHVEIDSEGVNAINRGLGWKLLIGDISIKFSDGGKYYFEYRINTLDASWGNSYGLINGNSPDVYNNASILGYSCGSYKSWSWWSYSGAQNEGFISNNIVVSKPEKYITGDKITIVVDCGDKSISYYKNDEFIGKPFENIEAEEVWPAVTLCGDLDSITILK